LLGIVDLVSRIWTGLYGVFPTRLPWFYKNNCNRFNVRVRNKQLSVI